MSLHRLCSSSSSQPPQPALHPGSQPSKQYKAHNSNSVTFHPHRRSCCISAQVHQERGVVSREYLERCLEAGGALDLASSAFGQCGLIEEAVKPTDICRKGTQLKKVVYQGNPGGYSHAVVGEAYGASAEAIPCVEMEAVFKAVETWVADAALIPIQNNLDGSIHRNYDLLLGHQLHIVGELAWHVNHCLLAHPHASISTLHRVVGHPQAISHCHNTLSALGLYAEEMKDTARAAALVGCSLDTALVASSEAANVFGLRLLRSSIQDDWQNTTRFLQLERQPIAAPRRSHVPCKTTIAIALRNGPSDLCRVLSAFALRDIKVTNLESRPAPVSIKERMQEQSKEGGQGQFKYVFVVDIEASMASQHTLKALRQVQEFCSFYRVLGSYALLEH
ncbi:hypothetical protein L7F22_046839 [Adiantum nelumboides]|nr:hypothetical protein [Adiantum nelumboides]